MSRLEPSPGFLARRVRSLAQQDRFDLAAAMVARAAQGTASEVAFYAEGAPPCDVAELYDRGSELARRARQALGQGLEATYVD